MTGVVELGPLVDHHCHGVVPGDLDRAGLEALMNEAERPSPLGTTLFDSMLGLAIRRWCAPLLDLEPHAPADAYVTRRRRLGADEVNRRLLGATGIDTFLVDTGLNPGLLTDPVELAELAKAPSHHEVVRLEAVAEQVLAEGTDDFAGAVTERLRTSDGVGFKSIAAYRVGLGLPDAKPTADALAAALTEVLPSRVAHPVVNGWLAWTAVELGRPLQLHVGYGDNDVDLADCDPLRLTAFLRATEERGVPVLLLHNYPFHRNAAYLAQVFEHVFMDVGLATHNAGALSAGLLRESLELAPFGKLLFSSDAYGLAELYHLATLLFRRNLGGLLAELVDADEMTAEDAAYVAGLV
ncbi:MAG: amidohydrolase, partial [Nocardioidaceae bacterium]|nr:amidohydrolase [Nocardioidaceae bacterium]